MYDPVSAALREGLQLEWPSAALAARPRKQQATSRALISAPPSDRSGHALAQTNVQTRAQRPHPHRVARSSSQALISQLQRACLAHPSDVRDDSHGRSRRCAVEPVTLVRALCFAGLLSATGAATAERQQRQSQPRSIVRCRRRRDGQHG